MKVGVLGAGQLGRMLALAGYPLGLRFRFLDHAADACAGQLAPLTVGEFDAATVDAFAADSDVLTFDWENVPVTALQGRAAAKLVPAPAALETGQDRWVEKEFFRALGIPTPAYRAVASLAELERAAAELGLPAVLKTRRLGYDGKGQRVLRQPADLAAAWAALAASAHPTGCTLSGPPTGAGPAALVLEAFVPFEREVSLLAVRGRDGEFRAWPLTENVHRAGILHSSIAPAADAALQREAEAQVERVMARLGYVGVLAVEYFVHGGKLLANEFAPRVHNSGHWTIEGAITSQFENHLRAIAGLPLGATAARGHAGMLNLIGQLPAREALLAVPGARLHDYGKGPRPGRKVGHVTVVEADRATLLDKLGALERLIA
jgi:5-(carboxyamino)imidazole ribonucleotide synthase